ncbi:GNAT family N-acetyltransferase [Altererythrobacter aurantiacus]|uniref:GNAT family N-acetyltransferase n=1 Tax=Parapontixanthobacter aurantiacus TaxID=1463599 RepID=A0A844Z881_9SPHN|nr:N-acetyltransferase [Parapontixanthobacter aurantiacus]MXO84791.1 GNAT family N-acetyltransferase [Parapontixanthobacter aurantiacus]
MAALIPLSSIDAELVEALLDRVFGPDRHARTAYRIRTGMQPLDALCFAALDEDDYLVATIQAWPVALGDRQGKPHPLIMIGPVAVLPERQGEGFGQALMAACLAGIGANGMPRLPQVLIGDADYYGRWDFTAGPARGWHCPGPYEQERLLVRCDNPAILPEEGMLGPWTGRAGH